MQKSHHPHWSSSLVEVKIRPAPRNTEAVSPVCATAPTRHFRVTLPAGNAHDSRLGWPVSTIDPSGHQTHGRFPSS